MMLRCLWILPFTDKGQEDRNVQKAPMERKNRENAVQKARL